MVFWTRCWTEKRLKPDTPSTSAAERAGAGGSKVTLVYSGTGSGHAETTQTPGIQSAHAEIGVTEEQELWQVLRAPTAARRSPDPANNSQLRSPKLPKSRLVSKDPN